MLHYTSGDVLRAKYDLLRHTAPHADVHLSQQLRAGLAPAVVLWQHGHLRRHKQIIIFFFFFKKDSKFCSER